MKLLGLDLGDAWIGVAISDALGMFARPLQTVPAQQLEAHLKTTLEKERIGSVVVGLPKTMRGTISEQTQKIIDQVEYLKQAFPTIEWILWDERLSSQRAQALKPATSKEEKLQSHSRAAAFILQSYLDHLSMKRTTY